MPKYMLIYRDPAESQTPPPSPEKMQGFLQLWDAWFKQFPGQVVEMGDGLLPTGRVLQPSGGWPVRRSQRDDWRLFGRASPVLRRGR
jgi:hypothetical protein